MAFLKRHSKPQRPQPRQVNRLGRTQAYAYHAQRSTAPQALGRQLLRGAVDARQAKRAARYWRQRFGLLLIIVATIFSIGNALALDTDPVVKPADPAAAVAFLHPMGTYERTAEQLLSSSLLNRNKITVDTNGVASRLQKQFPELSTVSITLPLFGRRPVLYIAQADPALLLTSTNGQSYIVDTSGRAIAPGSALKPSMQLLSVRDESGASIQLDTLAIPSTTVAFIEGFHFQLAQRQVHIHHFVLPPEAGELDVYLQDQRYFIKCNLESGSVLQQAGTFMAVQQYFDGRGIDPGQYVDVRVDGRVYYK